jgi:hypothetical protein
MAWYLTEAILGLHLQRTGLEDLVFSGAMLTAAWLGQGTVFLLVRRRGVAEGLAVVLVLVSLVAVVLVLMAPVTSAAASYNPSQPVSTQYKDILVRTAPVIILTILLNIYGTVGLVGGALYSAYLFWRKKVLLNRMLGNILIAAGALMPAMAGTLIQAGLVDWLYVSEFFGVVLITWGSYRRLLLRPPEACPDSFITLKPAARIKNWRSERDSAMRCVLHRTVYSALRLPLGRSDSRRLLAAPIRFSPAHFTDRFNNFSGRFIFRHIASHSIIQQLVDIKTVVISA